MENHGKPTTIFLLLLFSCFEGLLGGVSRMFVSGAAQVSNPVRYSEILRADDLGLDGGLYSLSSAAWTGLAWLSLGTWDGLA